MKSKNFTNEKGPKKQKDKEESLTFYDFENMMKHNSYIKKGGVIKQRR